MWAYLWPHPQWKSPGHRLPSTPSFGLDQLPLPTLWWQYLKKKKRSTKISITIHIYLNDQERIYYNPHVCTSKFSMLGFYPGWRCSQKRHYQWVHKIQNQVFCCSILFRMAQRNFADLLLIRQKWHHWISQFHLEKSLEIVNEIPMEYSIYQWVPNFKMQYRSRQS